MLRNSKKNPLSSNQTFSLGSNKYFTKNLNKRKNNFQVFLFVCLFVHSKNQRLIYKLSVISNVNLFIWTFRLCWSDKITRGWMLQHKILIKFFGQLFGKKLKYLFKFYNFPQFFVFTFGFSWINNFLGVFERIYDLLF